MVTMSEFEIEIYKALDKAKCPAGLQYVCDETGRSLTWSRNKLCELSEIGYIIKSGKEENGRAKSTFALTDLFSIAYSKATGETVALSDASKAIMRMRSHRLA